MRSIVRAYINSEVEKDRERALELCEQYGLNYRLMRLVILGGLIKESKRLGKAWYPAEGSRPLSEDAPRARPGTTKEG